MRIDTNSQSTFHKILLRCMSKKKKKDSQCFYRKKTLLRTKKTLHYDRKHFCCSCLQSCSTAQILERHVNDCFEINGKQMIKIAKKMKLLNSKTI